jgi:hypothetical protein
MLTKKNRSKYGVDNSEVGKIRRTFNGIRFDSRAEAAYAAQLDILKKTGVIEDYERQVPIDLIVNGRLVRKMKLDFRVRFPGGKTELVDVKGCPNREWLLAAKLFWAIHGYEIITVTNGVEKR